MVEINLIAVLLAIIINQMVGFVWYSPNCLGRLWLKTAPEACKHQANQPRSITLQFLSQVFSIFTLAILFWFFNIQQWQPALVLTGSIAAIVFLVQIADSSLEEMSITNQSIQIGYRIISLFITMGILLIF